ncbi:MAG TPA: cation diffusion facilitator family transporter [Terriglobia bacterium]|nr:cation diffusion facilitator family transporter [Terriglobia bacterium]
MHVHGHSRSAAWALNLGLALTFALAAAEFVAGHFGHSLALVSDGWHNLSDVPSLALAWFALRLEGRSPDPQRTYGYGRAGVLAAFVNALFMLAVAAYLCFEGYQRILRPERVSTGLMLGVGLLALVVNSALSFALSGGRSDLNLRAVFIHNLGDALSNLGIVAGAWLIARTGERMIDPLLAFLIAGMILWGTLGILSDSVNILLESAPKGMRLPDLATAMLAVPGVREVHDMHVWSLGSKSHALSCHVRILDISTSEAELIAQRIRDALKEEFGIEHTTIQFEHTHEPGDLHHRYYMPIAPFTKK